MKESNIIRRNFNKWGNTPVCEETPQKPLTFRPIGNKLLLRPVTPVQSPTLYVPEIAEKSEDIFEVVAMGTKVDLPGVNIGDKVAVKKLFWQNVKIDKEDWKIVKAEDIVGVFK
jgi:co-chaperonin GroES (HSP10)